MSERTDTHAHNPPGPIRLVDDDRLLSIARQETLSDETPDLAAAVLGDRARLEHVEDELARWDTQGEFVVEGAEVDFPELSVALVGWNRLSPTGQSQVTLRVLTALVAEASRVAQALRGGIVVRAPKDDVIGQAVQRARARHQRVAATIRDLRWDEQVQEALRRGLSVTMTRMEGDQGEGFGRPMVSMPQTEYDELVEAQRRSEASLRNQRRLNAEVNERYMETVRERDAHIERANANAQRVSDLEGEVQRLIQHGSDAYKAERDGLHAQLADAREQAVESGQRAFRAEAVVAGMRRMLDRAADGEID